MSIGGIWLVNVYAALADATHLLLRYASLNEELGNVFCSLHAEFAVELWTASSAICRTDNLDIEVIFLHGRRNLRYVDLLLSINEMG